ASTPKIGSYSGPIDVHVHPKGSGRSIRCQTALLAGDFGQRHALSAKLLWHRHHQVTRFPHFLEILIKEAVFPIVNRGPLPSSSEVFLRQPEVLGFSLTHSNAPHIP